MRCVVFPDDHGDLEDPDHFGYLTISAWWKVGAPQRVNERTQFVGSGALLCGAPPRSIALKWDNLGLVRAGGVAKVLV